MQEATAAEEAKGPGACALCCRCILLSVGILFVSSRNGGDGTKRRARRVLYWADLMPHRIMTVCPSQGILKMMYVTWQGWFCPP